MYSDRMISGRRRSVIFFIVLGICLVALAVTLNVGWIVLNWREACCSSSASSSSSPIIAGLVLNTIFLVREIRRNEQHDSFINAVTHELKTPVASIRLYLQTLQTPRAGRRRSGGSSTASCWRTAIGCCTRSSRCCGPAAPGRAGAALRGPVSTSARSRTSASSSRARASTSTPDALAFESACRRRAPIVLGDADELKAAVWNLIDNAVKYSAGEVACAASSSRKSTATALAVRVRDQRHRHLAGRAEADLPALLPHSGAASRSARRAAAWASSSCARSPRSTAAARSPRATGRATAARSRFCCRRRPRRERDRRTVLIVEDEQHLADGLRFNLEAEGYDGRGRRHRRGRARAAAGPPGNAGSISSCST